MHLDDLVRALLRFDALTARQWLADAARAGLVWSEVPAPLDLDQTECALAAGLVERRTRRPATTRLGGGYSAGTEALVPGPLCSHHAAPESGM
jgi:hypothetical protein